MNDPDDIERRLRELEAEFGPARVKEASAAERARQPARKSGWRNARKARKLRKPVQPPARGSQTPRRGRIWSLVVVVVVLACMAGAIVAIIRLARQPSMVPAAGHVPTTNEPTPSGRPTTGATSLLPSPTLGAPFLGTPAQSYANGAAGIVIPPAHAVSSYSAAQVAAAYQETKRLLIAANLDPATLRGGSPDAFASLLIPQQRTQFVSRLDVIGLSPGGSEKNVRTWVTSFAPGTTQFVGSVIKVNGTMRAMTGMNGVWHVLRIRADYLFVYALERPGQPLTLTRVVVRYLADDDFAAYYDPAGPLQPWWRLANRFDAGAQCGVTDGYVHPQFPSTGPGRVRPTGAPVNPYDQGIPVTKNRCQRTTGT